MPKGAQKHFAWRITREPLAFLPEAGKTRDFGLWTFDAKALLDLRLEPIVPEAALPEVSKYAMNCLQGLEFRRIVLNKLKLLVETGVRSKY